MHTSIVKFLETLANSRMTRNNRTKEVRSGLLKIYRYGDKMPSASHCIAFERIVTHLKNEFMRLQAAHNVNLSFTKQDVIDAVASFMPVAGSGARPHIVIRTEQRRIDDINRGIDAKHLSDAANDEWLDIFIPAVWDVLPEVKLPEAPSTDTVQ